MSTKNLADILFTKTRQAILRELILSNDKSIHLRELARRAGLDASGVRREISNLLEAGIIEEERSGNQKLYRINERCAVYPELKMLIIKTAGVADEIRKALEPLKDRIKKAFIYGSFADGTYDSRSDIDVMIVGDVTLLDVVGHTRDVSFLLRREINTVVFSEDEYNRRLMEEGFIKRVDSGNKIMLIGDSDGN